MFDLKTILRSKSAIIIGGLVLFTLLVLAVSGVFDGHSVAGAQSGMADQLGDAVPSPTPFQPQSGVSGFPFIDEAQPQPVFATPSPMSTITVEGGDYPTPIPLVLPTLVGISPYSLPAGINPLTGTTTSNPFLLERRPMAIKVTLFPRYVRPESGLTLADVVFEYYIEAGLSRFIAVFYGNDSEAVGPVRSGRFFDAHVARMYHAYLVFKYADKRVFDYLKESDLKDFLIVPSNAVGAIYSGPNSFDNYNNYFFNTRKFQDYLIRHGKDNTRQDLRGGYFYGVPPLAFERAGRIYTRYSVDDYHYWEYNSSLHKYFRYQEADDTRDGKPESYAPLTDAVTGRQVDADNVVVLFVPYTFADQFQEEDEVYHIDLIKSGKAYLFRDGIALPALWWRLTMDQPLLITDVNGNPLPLKPGRTFYEVIGTNSTFWQDGSDWHFRFATP
ncbi:MAG: DUF3048 domain-containing protein [Chloroflexi bacterium]|nr:DUF3048 domain-containing protein [Chloroflexota bacterium]